MSGINVAAVKIVLFLLFISVTIFMFSVAGIVADRIKAPVGATTVCNKAFDDITVIIDAGHGGEDGGAIANGIVEKDINLAVSLKLADFIRTSDTSLLLTRSDDRLLYKDGEEKAKKRYDLLNRVKLANEYENGVFISIHQNKFEIPKYKGLQVYYSPNNPQSKELAEIIQKNAKLYLDKSNNRLIKEADYRIKVLEMLEMPAVLVECGFISNPEEAELLGTNEYQNKLAYVIYLSLTEFQNNTEMHIDEE